MKKYLLIVLFILIWTSVVFADEYVLVMSKEDNVCQHMLKIYNEDLKKYGKIKYDQHDEFRAIKWEEKKYIWSTKAVKDSGILLVSIFDINNVSKEEIVLKIGDRGLKGISSDDIFIFNKGGIDTSKDEIIISDNLINKSIGILGGSFNKKPFKGNFYKLNELPAIEIWKHKEKLIPVKYFLGGWFYFHPFYYDGKYFIGMNDWHPDMIEKWEIILQYSPANHIKDVCYYLNVCENNSKNEVGK